MAGIGVNFFLSKSPSAGKMLPLDFGNTWIAEMSGNIRIILFSGFLYANSGQSMRFKA